MLSITNEPAPVQIVIRLIEYFSVKVTPNSVKEKLLSHPDFPSLLSITDILDEWKIQNSSYNVEIGVLKTLSQPFIAHLKSNDLYLIKSVDTDHINIIDGKDKTTKYSLKDFEENFSGNIIMFQINNDSGEVNFAEKVRLAKKEKFRKTGIFILILFLSISICGHFNLFTSIASWYLVTSLIIKVIGLIISILLLAQSIDSESPLVKMLCKIGEKANCNTILNSKSAKVFGTSLSWSEVGFVYYASTLLTLVFNFSNYTAISLLLFINIACLPYTFYSIYYQFQVAKRWCTLCCAIQFLLWLEFFVLFFSQKITVFPIHYHIFYSIIISLSFPILFWIYVKPYLEVKQLYLSNLKELNGFKENKDFFWSSLKAGTKYGLLKKEYAIILGNPNAKNVITIISNPYCKPCSELHKVIDYWRINGPDILFQFIFFPTSNNGKIVAEHLLSLKDSPQILEEAISNWFLSDNQNISLWIEKHPSTSITTLEIDFILDLQYSWCKKIELEHTPTILINGYKLPKVYHLKDIKSFI